MSAIFTWSKASARYRTEFSEIVCKEILRLLASGSARTGTSSRMPKQLVLTTATSFSSSIVSSLGRRVGGNVPSTARFAARSKTVLSLKFSCAQKRVGFVAQCGHTC
eukprot:6494516-Prymnesium_polylepis.2